MFLQNRIRRHPKLVDVPNSYVLGNSLAVIETRIVERNLQQLGVAVHIRGGCWDKNDLSIPLKTLQLFLQMKHGGNR